MSKRGINRCYPDPANVRSHDQKNLDAIKGSLKRFGQQKPIVVDSEGVIIAGNGTWQAAKELGWKTIDVRVSELEGVDRTAYAIADNRTAELAAWDEESLAETLKALSEDADFDETLTGFTEQEIEQILTQQSGEAIQDEVPEVDDEGEISGLDDVWICGRHRVCCGDSTKRKTVEWLMHKATPFMMVTDPPYGVNYDPQWRQDAAESGNLSKARRAVGEVSNDDQSSWLAAYNLFPGSVAYVWHASASASAIRFALDLMESGFEIRNQIIWRKTVFAISRGHYHWQHEPLWYCVRKGQTAKWCGDRSQSTIWDISNQQKDHTNHSTQKPVECMARPIRNHGDKGDGVYDPFLGSGTTLIACEQLGRTCYGIEISPKYVDVICKRYLNFTGESPVRESDGAVFAELIQEEEAAA